MNTELDPFAGRENLPFTNDFAVPQELYGDGTPGVGKDVRGLAATALLVLANEMSLALNVVSGSHNVAVYALNSAAIAALACTGYMKVRQLMQR